MGNARGTNDVPGFLTPRGQAMLGTPAFGGYFVDSGEHGDLYAWWTDGKLAKLAMKDGYRNWLPCDAPVYADLFPASESVADAPKRGTWYSSGRFRWICRCSDRDVRSRVEDACPHCGTLRPADDE